MNIDMPCWDIEGVREKDLNRYKGLIRETEDAMYRECNPTWLFPGPEPDRSSRPRPGDMISAAKHIEPHVMMCTLPSRRFITSDTLRYVGSVFVGYTFFAPVSAILSREQSAMCAMILHKGEIRYIFGLSFARNYVRWK